VVFIHGAGYLQNVTDSMTEYAVNLMFHSRLAEQGYVVADVDYRGSAGYGGKFRGDVQFQLGKLELADIGAVIDELARRGVIDPARVACYGGSYGGFLTLMALFQEPDRWVGGAALRSVTDWRTYHPGYTQPRLGRPSTHPEAYAASSPIDHAEKLRDPLLILHGMVDSNVFAQDSIRLIEKLIDLGIDFDAMLYPSQDPGFEDGMHWLDEYRRIERFLVRCLEEQ
jgi:dipeptidyl aminopeptidase/acylaminoacyl peptidase